MTVAEGGMELRNSRNNSFNLLRLAAAAVVFLSHEHLFLEQRLSPPGILGVYVFFGISGFLVARSWDQRPSSLQYFKNRALRILPALWAVVLLTTFLIGPLATSLPVSEYLSDPRTWRYLLNLVFDLQRQLPGVFYSSRYPIVNQPLWTLAHETLFYTLLALFGLVLRAGLRYLLLALYLLVMAEAAVTPGNQSEVIASDLPIYFLGGALLWYFREYLALRGWLFLLALAALVLQVVLGLHGLLWGVALPYAVVWLGLRKPPALLGHFVRNDYSYGLYVWGMVSQQLVLWAGVSSPWLHILLSGLLVVLCAACSWHLLEKPCLALKHAGRRGKAKLHSSDSIAATANRP